MTEIGQQHTDPDIEAAFFDIDRTLVASGTHMLHQGLPDVLDPEHRPFAFTEITARGVALYQDVLRKNPELAPSPDMPLGLEYGTHIVTSNDYYDAATYKSVHHSSLNDAERSQLVSFLGSVPFMRVAFYSHDPAQPRTIWLPEAYNDRTAPQEPVVVHAGSVNSLARAMQDAQPGMVAVKLPSAYTPSLPESLTIHATSFSGTTTYDMLPQHTDKRDAVLRIASLLGLPHEALFTAGDSLPDLGMLTIEGIRSAVVRNPKVHERVFPVHIPRVEPDRFAHYLAALNK